MECVCNKCAYEWVDIEQSYSCPSCDSSEVEAVSAPVYQDLVAFSLDTEFETII